VQACNSVMHNANVRYYLYGQFVDDEHSYLHGPTEAQHCLPHLSFDVHVITVLD